YAYAHEDIAKHSPDHAERARADSIVSFLTPIVKGLLTESAIECTYHALQIFGGHGYIVEHRMGQVAPDARLTTLDEGPPPIQAADLLGRKVMQLQGEGLKHFLLEIGAFCEKHATDPALGEFVGPLVVAAKEWSDVTMDVARRSATNPEEMGAAAYDYLFFSG